MHEVSRRPLARELSSGFRLIAVAAAVMVAAVVGVLSILLWSALPAQRSSDAVLAQLQPVVENYFDARSDVRTFLVTGSPSYLAGFSAKRADLVASLNRVAATSQKSLVPPAVRLRSVVLGWLTGDAASQASQAGRARLVDRAGELTPAANRMLTEQGRRLSSEFFGSRDRLVAAAQDQEDNAEDQERWALLSGGLAVALIGAGTGVVAATRGRRLTRSLLEPISSMLDAARSVGRGEFQVEAVDSEVTEIAELSDGLADMATSLRLQQKALAGRVEQSQRLAERLRRVLGFARDISSSLTVDTVLQSVTKAACLLAGNERARVRLLDVDGLTVAYDTQSRDGEESFHRCHPGEGTVGQAVAGSRIAHGPVDDEAARDEFFSYALPLIANGRTIGALEVWMPARRPRVSEEVLETLEVVAGQGATAIDAARLYQRTERLSLSDALTGLGNRRRLDHDLSLEVERAGRYGRPMSLLMIDVDHFKAINDQYGHAHGDTVLQDLAAVMTDHMRSVDTAYRYGGEEIAVLARETDLAGAARLGERLRDAIERRFAASTTPATISIGIATAPSHAATVEALLNVADSALYRAKRAGRNRVMVADESAPLEAGHEPAAYDDRQAQPVHFR